MPAKLKTSLKALREEPAEGQSTAVFYDVSDPATGKSFRLYEVEYLIAQMLDGHTSHERVVERARDELQFEFALTDLEKFLKELRNLDFLVSDDEVEPASGDGEVVLDADEFAEADLDPTPAAIAEAELLASGAKPLPAVATTPAVAVSPALEAGPMGVESEPFGDDISGLLSETLQNGGLNLESPPVPVAAKSPLMHELERLTRSGLLHIKQGLTAQARDYFLAARRCADSDEPEVQKATVMLNHLDVVGGDDTNADVEYLWKQASQLYPELCAELGPPGAGDAPAPFAEEDSRQARAQQRARGGPRRWLTRVAAAAVVLLAAGAAVLGYQKFAVGPVTVETDQVRTQRVTLYYAAEAVQIEPARQWSLSFDRPGTIAEVFVRPSETVKKGQVLARLTLPPPQERVYRALYDRRIRAEKQYLASTLDIERMLVQQTDRQEEIRTQKEKLEELQSSLVLKPLTAAQKIQAKKDLLNGKRQLQVAQRDLERLKLRLKGPEAQKQRLAVQKDLALSAEFDFESKQEGAFLRAPENATVMQVELRANDGIIAGRSAKRLVLADPDTMAVTWAGAGPTAKKADVIEIYAPTFGEGGDAEVVNGTVQTADPLTVQIKDPQHRFLAMNKKNLRIVREQLASAILVPAGAKTEQNDSWVLEDGHVQRRAVDWIEVRGREAIARSGLKPGETVVVGPSEAMAKLHERDAVRSAKVP